MPVLDCIRLSILLQISSDRGILMVSDWLAILRMSWLLICSILTGSALETVVVISRFTSFFCAIPLKERARRRMVMIVSSRCVILSMLLDVVF